MRRNDNEARAELGISAPVMAKLRAILRSVSMLQPREQIDEYTLAIMRTAIRVREEEGIFKWEDAVRLAISRVPGKGQDPLPPTPPEGMPTPPALDPRIERLRKLIFDDDGTPSEHAFRILSAEHGERYEEAMIAMNVVSDFFRDAGSEEFARLAPHLFEMAAKALAFDVAHRRGWIAPNE